MPPRYLRRRSLERLKPCAEFTVEACDIVPADQCCGVIPCKLCIEWETYADGISYGSAEFATSSWTGTVGGVAFVSYWERNYDGECEYIITLDGEEVYRATCYEGASCRDPAGEVAVSTAYLEGTLRWSKYEPRELQLIDDPDTGCRDFFCGTCRCSCECLCVTITEYSGDVFTGEICDTAYDCDPPVWVGTVGSYDLSIALGRDEYGACIVTFTVDGVDQEPVATTGCGNMTASITLANGDVIAIRCKQCSCVTPPGPCQCDGRGNPNSGTANPLPEMLTVDISSDASDSTTGCFNGSGTIPFLTVAEGGLECWEGDVTGTCTDCNNVSRTWSLHITVCCADNELNQYSVRIEGNSPSIIPLEDQSVTVVATSCDPFLLEGCITGEITAFVVGCTLSTPPDPTIFTNVCFQVYETP